MKNLSPWSTSSIIHPPITFCFCVNCPTKPTDRSFGDWWRKVDSAASGEYNVGSELFSSHFGSLEHLAA